MFVNHISGYAEIWTWAFMEIHEFTVMSGFLVFVMQTGGQGVGEVARLAYFNVLRFKISNSIAWAIENRQFLEPSSGLSHFV